MEALLQNLNSELKNIPFQISTVKQAETAISICQKYVIELRLAVQSYQFQNQQEEIRFFKYEKPQFLFQLIYHLSLYKIEFDIPTDPLLKEKRYLLHLNQISQFIKENVEFYGYILQNETYLDDQYFVRNHANPVQLADAHNFLSDPIFTTSHDYKVAQILANDRLLVYLQQQLKNTEERTYD
jgi:RteC protein